MVWLARKRKELQPTRFRRAGQESMLYVLADLAVKLALQGGSAPGPEQILSVAQQQWISLQGCSGLQHIKKLELNAIGTYCAVVVCISLAWVTICCSSSEFLTVTEIIRLGSQKEKQTVGLGSLCSYFCIVNSSNAAKCGRKYFALLLALNDTPNASFMLAFLLCTAH